MHRNGQRLGAGCFERSCDFPVERRSDRRGKVVVHRLSHNLMTERETVGGLHEEAHVDERSDWADQGHD